MNSLDIFWVGYKIESVFFLSMNSKMVILRDAVSMRECMHSATYNTLYDK